MDKVSKVTLQHRIDMAVSAYPVGSFWVHYKGVVYTIKSYSIDVESQKATIHYYEPSAAYPIVFSRSHEDFAGIANVGMSDATPTLRFYRKAE